MVCILDLHMGEKYDRYNVGSYSYGFKCSGFYYFNTREEYMKEKPIIFNTEMVRAIMAGNKTQTRRIVKKEFSICEYEPDLWHWQTIKKDGWISHTGNRESFIKKFCNYEIGQTLWVRETWQEGNILNDYYYKALCAQWSGDLKKWKPSIFMPRKAARIFLKIKEIRIEKIQDITLQDIEREGIKIEQLDRHDTIIDNFIKLWDSINKKRGYGWEQNCYVWVYDFEAMNEKN